MNTWTGFLDPEHGCQNVVRFTGPVILSPAASSPCATVGLVGDGVDTSQVPDGFYLDQCDGCDFGDDCLPGAGFNATNRL